jgi:hypothetical protein
MPEPVENVQVDVPAALELTEMLEGEQDPLMPFESNGEIVTVPENPSILVAVSWKLPPLPAVTLTADGLVARV